MCWLPLAALCRAAEEEDGSPVPTDACDRGQWIAKLRKAVEAPRRWHDLAVSMEKRLFHRSQLMTWAQRYLQLRHERALANLTSLMTRVRQVHLGGQPPL